tara:strand:- start:825 stop:1274 length:450 start_codon:yes stop_codon:yes gene_type:complete
MEILASYGYWGLFLTAFIAGSILPFSAEVVLTILLYKDYPMVPLILIATLGNWLGGYTVFFFGYFTRWDLIKKYLGIETEKIRQFKLKKKYPDEIQALFCWIPFVGSLLLISLGIKKASIYKTGFFMFLGRLGRYVIWAMLTLKIINIV